jgi:L-alanine-DL-glutamate epimerase-like enolase superfamily enzyme
MTTITSYSSLQTVRHWGRPLGDVNSVARDGVRAVPVLLLHTDDGRTGVGLGPHAGIDTLFKVIQGQDPRGVAALYNRMISSVFKAGHGGSIFSAIGAVDCALWDLKAQLAGEPLWRHLGALDRFVPGYASALDFGLDDKTFVSVHRGFVERGFTAVKLKGGADVVHDLARLKLLRELYARPGVTPVLMLDVNEVLTAKEAVRYVCRIEREVDLAWIEEPVRRWDAPGLAAVRTGVRAAVATGENLTGLEQYAPLIRADAVDVVQTSMVFGISHFLRVAAAAHLHSLPVSLISYRGHIVAHAANAVPNHQYCEIKEFGEPPVGLHLDQDVENGGLRLGDLPGNGITVDRHVVEALMREHGQRAGGPASRSQP